LDNTEKECKSYQCKLSVNERTIDFLKDITNFKQEINWINGTENRLNCESLFNLYPNYLVLDNDYFTQKIFYDKIDRVEFSNNMSGLFGNAITLILGSNHKIFLNISNMKNNEFYDLKDELIEKVKNPPILGRNEILKVINCIVIEKLETLYKSDNITSLKKDISSLNKTVFEENGVFIIFDNHLKIENAIFIQEFPYSLIKNIDITDELINLLLDNNETITLKFNINEELTDELKNKIQKNITNPPNFSTKEIHNRVTSNPVAQVNSFGETNNLPNNTIVINKKSNALCFILNLLFCGAGYAYVDHWLRFIISFFIIWPILIFIGFATFMIPPILYWLYVVVNSNSMVNEYNKRILNNS